MSNNEQLGLLTRRAPRFVLPALLWLRATPFGKAYTRRRWAGVRIEAQWQGRRVTDAIARWRMTFLNEAKRVRLVEELAAATCSSDVQVTATVACRRRGNRDSNLPALLDSMIALAADIRRVELVVKVDPDDDLLYFRALKRRYQSRMDLRVFVTDRMNGYPDGHHFHDFLVRQANPASRVWIVLTDDCRMVRSGWDDTLIAALADGRNYFIGGDKPLEAILPADSTAADPLSGSPAHYLANDYPFASLALLKVIREAVDDPRWTCFGDEFCFDAFFSAMVSKLHSSQGLDLYIRADKFVQRGGVLVFHDVPTRSRARTETLIRFMSAAAEGRRAQVAAAIARAARA